MTPNTTYRYVVFPPDGTAYTAQSRNYVGGGYSPTFTTDATGRCMQTGGGGTQVPWYAQLSLQTPLTASPDPITVIGPSRSGATDAPYSGVWTIAVQNTGTNAYEAIAFTVVLGTLNFNTFSDPAYTTVSSDFTSGGTVYVSAGGLNPAHFYSFGFINSSGNGMPCVYAIPAGSQNFNNATCFVSGATGIIPTAQTLTGTYATPAAGANSAGTQTVQLYDATTNDLISTQQYSLNPGTVVWSPLIPYNGATNGANLNDTFATDGILGSPGAVGLVQEQSVQGLTYQASGVVSGRTYRLTISNGNGVVLSSTTTDAAPAFGSPQAFSLPFSFTAASTSTGPQKLAFPINTANFTSFGATQTPFGPNVYTAQLYDVASGAVIGSKSFRIVSYSGQFQWTNPAGAYVNANAGGIATNVTTTLRNDAGSLYGVWNADGIKSITINNDSGNFVNLGLQGGVTTTTDSLGQLWDITNPNSRTVVLTPRVAGQSLAPDAIIPIPMTVAVAAGNCNTACVLQTQITPLHGVAASTINPTMTNRATNGLNVYGFGVIGSNTQATYSWQTGAYSAAQLGTPRYRQMMYRLGTDAAANPGTYTVTLTVVNNGAPAAMSSLRFDMPPTVDSTRQNPCISSATINGVNQTANWGVKLQAINNVLQNPCTGSVATAADNSLATNSFALVASNGATLGIGKTATFVLKLPILPSAFPFQQIAATANYAAGSYSVGPTNVLTNAIAGTTNLDSTELGAFSLDPALMYANVTPAVVPALANATWQYEFDNTSTGLDPNPDYVSQLLITVPAAGAGNFPTITSVTSSTGVTFNANPTGTAGQWLLDLCASSTAPVVATQTSTPCTAATDANSLPPGGKLFINFKYSVAPAVGTYPINWTIVGANGGAVVAAAGSQIPNLVVANTTAQTSFTFAGGYKLNPSYPPVAPIQSVPFGSQPVVGSWSDFNEGNGYVYELFNNGSTVITDVSIAIPWANTSGQLFDTTSPWSVDGTSVFTYGAGAAGPKCSGNGFNSLVQAVNGAPGTSGLLRLSGCNLAVGQKLDVFLYAKNPYDIGSTFRFDASVATANATPPDPRVAGNPNALPIYSLSNTVRIIADARLAIEIPTGSPGSYVPALFGGSTPAVACAGCTFNSAGALPLINLNQINGTFTATDSLAASVYTNSTNGWNLSVSADVNPGTSSGQLSTWVTGNSTVYAGYNRLVTAAPGTVIPTAGTLALSNWAGTVRKAPIDNIMSYRVTVNPLSVNNNTTTTVTLTYTLIAN
jgi:hypothetical protein